MLAPDAGSDGCRVGPDSAAVLLITAGDNPDRITDEASFAALRGVSPVEQSSGKPQRRRLNRGGNRQANAALYRIVMIRIRWDERTQKYLQRRTAEGMSKRARSSSASSGTSARALPAHPASGHQPAPFGGLTKHRGCYATHNTPAIKKCLLTHPRFHLHFTTTGSSWSNLVERWFAELTSKQTRRGVHRSVQALEKDIRNRIADWNTDPKPYAWTKTADEILERLASYLNRIPDSED